MLITLFKRKRKKKPTYKDPYQCPLRDVQPNLHRGITIDFDPSEWPSPKRLQRVGSREALEKRRPPSNAAENKALTASLENSMEIPYNPDTSTIWSGNPTLGCTCGAKYDWKRHMYPNIHCSTIYNSQDMQATIISFQR